MSTPKTNLLLVTYAAELAREKLAKGVIYVLTGDVCGIVKTVFFRMEVAVPIHISYQHQNMLTTRISLPPPLSLFLFLSQSLSVIVLGKSSRRHQVFLQNWWMQVVAGRPTLVCPCVGVHRKTSFYDFDLTSPACHTCLSWIVCEIRGK